MKKRKKISKRKSSRKKSTKRRNPEKHIIILQSPQAQIINVPNVQGGRYSLLEDFNFYDSNLNYIGRAGLFELKGESEERPSSPLRFKYEGQVALPKLRIVEDE